jgi:phosphoheptose isomerase
MQNPFKFIKPFMVKHEPEILTGMGVSGLIFSTIWGIKATVSAVRAIDKYKAEKNIDKITFKEGFKLAWKFYWPVAAGIVASIPCIIAGNRVANKRYAALATAYTISETALQEYQEKTREIVGEKKAREIQEGIDADRINKTYKSDNQVIMVGNGESLFYEPLSGRYFKSNWNDISKAANELNSQALSGIPGEITLNEWFNRLGLEDTEMGDYMGWSLTNNPTNLIDVEISSHITKDNVPCGAISYGKQPTKLSDSFY